MARNVSILGVATYHPDRALDNYFFVDHFKRLGLDWVHARAIMKHLGRRTRFIVDDAEEDSLTMGLVVAKNVLVEVGISGPELDSIVFASETPEYTMPTNAVKIHHALGGKANCLVYDTNANCAGMLVAIEQLRHVMIGHSDMSTALVIGSEFASHIANPMDVYFYPTFSDGSAAVLLGCRFEESLRGILQSVYYCDSTGHDNMLFPPEGLSKIGTGSTMEKTKVKFVPGGPASIVSETWAALIRHVLAKEGIGPEAIDFFCFSQFSHAENDATLKILGVSTSRHLYVGDQIGYPGVASPFFSYRSAWEHGLIGPGAVVVFASVGAGNTYHVMLYRA